MARDTTVIYYTANREKDEFEQRIRDNMLKAIGDTPLISVSQKPINFGKNIYIGNLGHSSQNAYRQLQLGAMAADTEFVTTAEADFIYPEEYFRYIPPKDNVMYMAMPLWVLFAQRGKARVFCRKPRGSEAAMVVGRRYLIDQVDKLLEGQTHWGMKDASELPEYLVKRDNRDRFTMKTPAITFKTDQQMHRRTPHDTDSKTRYLEPYGHAKDIINKYLG